MRLLHVARDISVFLSAAGPEEARAVVERRAGHGVRAAARRARRAQPRRHPRRAGRDADVGAGARARAVPAGRIAGERVDTAFAAIAAFTDLKSPWLREHSTGVAELAEAAAWRMGLPAASVTLVRRAALAHDLGRVGVSNAIWEKPGPLGFGELGARAAPSSLHGARLRPVGGARSDRDPGRLAPRAARRLRLPPRHARAGARPGGPHPRRRRLLRGDARGAAVQAGARRAGRGGGADARGEGGAARPGRRRRGARRRRAPRARSGLASCRPG